MINNFHLDIKQIFEAAPPEQKILINMVSRIVGERASFQQYYYQGVFNTEQTTYNTNRLFLILQAEFSYTIAAPSSAAALILYDENNIASLNALNMSAMWDATAAAAKMVRNNITLNNFYFSRLAVGQFANCRLIGFKITY